MLEHSVIELPAEDSLQLTATVLDSTGAEVQAPLEWRSTEPDVATVTAAGEVRTWSAGSTAIIVSSGDAADTAHVTVIVPLDLILPIGGELGENVFIIGHSDHNSQVDDGGSPESFLRDYTCNLRTQDQYDHTAFQVGTFEQADAGVPVVAGAAGVVERVVVGGQGLPGVSEGWGTEVTILHQNGFRTRYGSLDASSVAVSQGDEVAAGAVLGNAGGTSAWLEIPGLLFSVIRPNGNTTDPFSGDCGSRYSHWREQPAYSTQMRVLRQGLFAGSIPEYYQFFRLPPVEVDTVTADHDWVAAWADMLNLGPARLAVRFTAPDGEVREYETEMSYNGRLGLGLALAVPSLDPGNHSARITIEDSVVVSYDFYVAPAPQMSPSPAPQGFNAPPEPTAIHFLEPAAGPSGKAQ